MSIESRIRKYSARIELMAEKLRNEELSNVELYTNFLNFVSENREQTYYPITKLLNAAKCNEIEALDVANYFSIGEEPLLVVTFCYFDFDGTDIEIDKESFIESITKKAAPIEEESGHPIENFELSRLGFYCNLVNE